MEWFSTLEWTLDWRKRNSLRHKKLGVFLRIAHAGFERKSHALLSRGRIRRGHSLEEGDQHRRQERVGSSICVRTSHVSLTTNHEPIVDSFAANRVRAPARRLSNNGGAFEVLEVVTELLGAGECARRRQHESRRGGQPLAGTIGRVQYCCVTSVFRFQMSFRCVHRSRNRSLPRPAESL